jgi:D-arabinono-1,4-lactone oxidase
MALAQDRFEELLQQYEVDTERVERMSAQDVVDFLGGELEATREQEGRLRALEAAPTLQAIPIPAALRDLPFDRARGAYRPQSVQHVQRLVRYALDAGVRVRAMGSRHSPARSIDGDATSDLLLLLDGELRRVEFLETGTEADGTPFARVRVGAGCYLGINPSDRSQREEDSLTRQLEARGYALPILGGITHQSVAGFLQTGSAGGSFRHGMSDTLEELELVDGQGEVRHLRKGTDLFDAAAVSMGLYGVITHATFRVGPSYFVEGFEENRAQADSMLARRPGGGYAFTEALHELEYMRVNWFPQKYVRRVMQWSGRRAPHGGPRRPYEAPLRNPLQNVLAAAVMKLSSGALHIDPRSDLAHRFVGTLLRKFTPLEVTSRFRDLWYLTLPSDDPADTDHLIQVLFTEVWLPVERSNEVIALLEELLREDQAAAGNFAVELYGAKRSPFWLSAAYAQDVIRVDPYWWAYNFGSPEAYFTRYWKRLLDVKGARFHWGKYLPTPGLKYGQTRFGLDYLRSVYPRLDDWLALRRELDPRGVFLTDYWRRTFELA